ncbi:MAG: hypothetical protein MUC74_11910 [Ideonella sp.]|jgi:hypothetical protein|nr:hypothetical protein [Ideonella sp.]
MTTPTTPPAAPPRRFACAQCGGTMAFDPLRAQLACTACGHTLAPSPVDAAALAEARREQDYLEALRRLAAREPTLEARVVDCPSCGAQTRLDGHVVADRCAFCATPLVLDRAHVERLIRPQAVVPFALDRSAAQQRFARWLGGLWFAPDALKKTVREADGVRGVYLPYWTYDARTATRYRGERGDDRTVIQRTAQGERRQTVTDWSPAAGAVDVAFDDVLVVGSPSIPAHLARVLDGWQLDRLEPYRDEVLAGFTVEAYRKGLEDGFREARQRMEAAIDTAIRRDIGGDRQRIDAKDTAVDEIRFKHLLLPVWIGSYRFGERGFQVVVNAQTGQIAGDRPWSKWKVGLAVAATVLAILVLTWLAEVR